MLALLGTFEFILASAAFTILLYYTITNISALKQPYSDQRYGKVVPILGLLGCLLMAFSLNIQVIISGLLVLTTGFVFRFIMHKVYKK
jgi:APA family basic amino acid/polyamine antiporter